MIDPGPELAGIMTAELSSVLGDLRLEFRRNGQYNAEINGLTINHRFSSVTDAQGNPMWVESVVLYNGQVVGTFQTQGPEGSKTLTGAPLLTTGSMQTSMAPGGGGDPQEFASIPGVLPSAQSHPYTCEEKTLTLTYTDPVTEATYQNIHKRLESSP